MFLGKPENNKRKDNIDILYYIYYANKILKKYEVCSKNSWTALKIILPVIGFSLNSTKCYFSV